MRSSFLGARPRLRRSLPWALWLTAAAVAVPMGMRQSGIGASPAMVEARVATLAPMRTDHRLRVREVLVAPGQHVKTGDLLVQMDTAEIDADLAIAQARLAYIEITSAWQQVRMIDQRARTTHALAAGAERTAVDVARLIAEAERDRSALTQLDLNLDVEEKLVGDQLADAQRLRTLRLQRAALAKKVDEYQETVARARQSAVRSRERLGRWQQDQPRPPQSPQAPDVRAAACALQRQHIVRLQLLRSYHAIRAPFAGRVGEILLRAGELSADPASPVLTLVEEQSSGAVAYLDQRQADRVRLGDQAQLVPRDLSGTRLSGRVVALAPSIAEIPVRFRRVPTLHEFGRNVYIQLDEPANLPGQAFDAVFHRDRRGVK